MVSRPASAGFGSKGLIKNLSFGACKPDSVRPAYAGLGGHFSQSLSRRSRLRGMRHTREYSTGRRLPYFVLHRIGFFVPPRLRGGAVGSYPTFSLSPHQGSLARTPAGYLFSVTLSVAAA